jgi:hypothetical protein
MHSFNALSQVPGVNEENPGKQGQPNAGISGFNTFQGLFIFIKPAPAIHYSAYTFSVRVFIRMMPSFMHQ